MTTVTNDDIDKWLKSPPSQGGVAGSNPAVATINLNNMGFLFVEEPIADTIGLENKRRFDSVGL